MFLAFQKVAERWNGQKVSETSPPQRCILSLSYKLFWISFVQILIEKEMCIVICPLYLLKRVKAFFFFTPFQMTILIWQGRQPHILL